MGLFEQLQLWRTEAAAPTAAPAPPPAATPEASRTAGSPQYTVLLRGMATPYGLKRSTRRTIGFVVGADGLRVNAPRWVRLQDVEAALQSKADWILRKLQEQEERRRRTEAQRLRWEAGADVPYLGQRLRLVLDPQGVATPGGVAWDEGAACLRVGLPPDAEPTRIRDAVHGWWQRQARVVFEQRCAVYAPRLGVKVQRLSLSSAQTRWGSAGVNGTIRLNWRLIHYPLSSIDYVVVHELAHLREMNHSAAFWEVVRSVMPDYATAQAPLRQAPPLMD